MQTLAWAPSETLPLDELERDGLISRTVSTADRRRFDVCLTLPGRQQFEQALPGHADGIGRYFVQPLFPRDTEDLAPGAGASAIRLGRASAEFGDRALES